MTVNELQLQRVTYHGDEADFFTINSRFSGYTVPPEHLYYHVLDINTNAYTSYTADQLNAAFASGYFEDPGNVPAPENSNSSSPPDNTNGSSILPDLSNWTAADYIKYGFIALAVIMVIHIATK